MRLLTRGVPITVVSELLGHSDINPATKRYGGFASGAKVKWHAVRMSGGRNDATSPGPPRLVALRGGLKTDPQTS